LAVRHGRCRKRKIRFSLLPDFLIPRLRLTRRSVEKIQAALHGKGVTLRAAIDTCFNPWNEPNLLPVSTAYFALESHAFEAFWARTQEKREILLVRPRRQHRHLEPKRFVSVSTCGERLWHDKWVVLSPWPVARAPPVPSLEP
jgi:hypothetical protein